MTTDKHTTAVKNGTSQMQGDSLAYLSTKESSLASSSDSPTKTSSVPTCWGWGQVVRGERADLWSTFCVMHLSKRSQRLFVQQHMKRSQPAEAFRTLGRSLSKAALSDPSPSDQSGTKSSRKPLATQHVAGASRVRLARARQGLKGVHREHSH